MTGKTRAAPSILRPIREVQRGCLLLAVTVFLAPPWSDIP